MQLLALVRPRGPNVDLKADIRLEAHRQPQQEILIPLSLHRMRVELS